MALLIEIQHIPLQKYDSHQKPCMPLFITLCGTVYDMAKNIENTCVKHHLYIRALNIADLLFQLHE